MLALPDATPIADPDRILTTCVSDDAHRGRIGTRLPSGSTIAAPRSTVSPCVITSGSGEMTNAVACAGCGGGSTGFVAVGVGVRVGVVALSLHDNTSMTHEASEMRRASVFIIVILGLIGWRESTCRRRDRSRRYLTELRERLGRAPC